MLSGYPDQALTRMVIRSPVTIDVIGAKALCLSMIRHPVTPDGVTPRRTAMMRP